jgi:hypothetical protein
MKLSGRAVNRERWQAEIESWRASGRKLSAWARERNLSRDALEYGKRRISAATPSALNRTPLTLIPIHSVLPAAPDTAPIELIADARPGLRIRLATGFDAASLVRVLDLLEARC